MPKLNIEIPHNLSTDDARGRLEKFAEVLQDKYKDQVSELDQSWEGDNLSFGFKTFGIKIDGKIGVQDKQLVVDGDLPFSAMMFKGKIESEIRGQLERLMA